MTSVIEGLMFNTRSDSIVFIPLSASLTEKPRIENWRNVLWDWDDIRQCPG
jgi:hypothetical protein